MRVLLTGATGFIGKHMLEQLVAQNDTVRVLVRPSALNSAEPVLKFAKKRQVEVVEASLTDGDSIVRALQDVEIVYHLAWHSHRRSSYRKDGEEQDPAAVNEEAIQHILQGCREHGVRRLVFTSSVAVYGASSDRSRWPLTEETPFGRGAGGGDYASNYIQPKIEVENAIRSGAAESGFEYVILRPAIVYGVGWHGAKRLLERALDGPGTAWQAGNEAGLQMVHIQDMVIACLLAGIRPEAAGREFNIAGPEMAESSEMINYLRTALFFLYLGMAAPERSFGKQHPYPRYDTTKAALFLGFTPRVRLSQGLAELAETLVPRKQALLTSRKAHPNSEQDSSTGKPVQASTLTATEIKRSKPEAKLTSQAKTVGKVYDRRIQSKIVDEYYSHSDFWNWGLWKPGTKNQRQACENLMEKLLSFLPRKQGKILDVACGKGATTRYLLKYYPPQNVVGINITEKQLEVCRKNAPGCTFRLMDATNLEFEDCSFDSVICVEAPGHFDTRAKFLREAYRVLKPGGMLVLSDPVFSPRRWMSAQQIGVIKANYVRDAEDYRQVCLKAGFTSVTTKDTTRESWIGFSDHFEAYLDRKLRNGSIGWVSYTEFMNRHDRLAACFEFYIVAACQKGSN